MTASNLYDAAHRFRLIIPSQSLTLAISEPIGYREARIQLKRDREYYGMNYEFFDESVKLQFEQDNGINELRTLYTADGGDGIAKFQHFVFNNATMVFDLLFEGNLNFNTYNDDGTTVSCEVEKVSFENLLRTRFDTKVALLDQLSLDGEASPAVSPFNMELHSREITRQFVTNAVKPYVSSAFYDKITAFETDPFNQVWKNNSLIQVMFTHEIQSGLIRNEDLSNFNGQTMSAEEYDAPLAQPSQIRPRNIQADAKENGLWDVDIAVRFRFWSQQIFDLASAEVQSIITTYFVIYDKNNNLKLFHTVGGDVITGWSDGFARIHNKAATLNDVSIQKGDVCYLFSRFIFQATAGVPNYDYSLTGITFRIYEYNNTLNITSRTTAPATNAVCYSLRDAIRKNISMVTNVNNALDSDFFKNEGLPFVITNGMILRGFFAAIEPVKTSLKELFESINALWNLGVLIHNNSVKIEPFEWFFQDRFILHISDTSEFKEETASELLLNEMIIGYSKTATEDIQTLDEFNIQHRKLLPIRTFKKEIKKLSAFIGSGYALELQRRVQFDENDTRGGKFDKELFIISQNRSDFTKAEKDEFMELLNVLSPETVYNARISPQRMTLKWKSFIDSIAAFKPETDKTQTTFTDVERSSQLSLKWLTGASYPVEIAPNTPTIENEDLFVDDDKKIFWPVYHKFKTRLSFQDFLILKKSLTATFGNTKDNGYITYIDSSGSTLKGFVMDMIYQPISEECEFVCLKKYDKP